MIEQPDLGEDVTVFTLDVDLEFFLRYREDPILVRTTFVMDREVLSDSDNPLETFMDYLESAVLSVLDTRGEERYVFSDERFNKRIISTAEIQGISILAPDLSNLQTHLQLAE